MKRILAIDNALATSGWAIFDDDKLYETGVFKTNSTESIEKRLSKIFDYLDCLKIEYDFDQIIFEDCQQQSNRNVQTFHKLSMVKAIILYFCDVTGTRYKILSPSQWRKILKDEYKISWGKIRTQQKNAAKNFVKEKFNKDISEDECDAICLGLAGIIENKKIKSAF